MSKALQNLIRSISVADPHLVSEAVKAIDPIFSPATLLKKADDILPYYGRDRAKDLGLGPNAQNAAYILGNMARRLPAAAALTYGGAELGSMAARYGGGTKGGLFNLLTDTFSDGPTEQIAEASEEDKWWDSLSDEEQRRLIAISRRQKERPEVIAFREEPEPAVMPIEAVDSPPPIPVRPVSLRHLEENMIGGHPYSDRFV